MHVRYLQHLHDARPAADCCQHCIEQVEVGEAAAAASQLMARAASEVLQLRAQPGSSAADDDDTASAGLPLQRDSAGAPSEPGQLARDEQPASATDAVLPRSGWLPAPGAAAVSCDVNRPCLPPVRTSSPAASDGQGNTSSGAGTGPSTPDAETAAVPTAMTASRQLRRLDSGGSASSDAESTAGSDAASDAASPAAQSAERPIPAANSAFAGLADAELSLCATAVYYTER